MVDAPPFYGDSGSSKGFVIGILSDLRKDGPWEAPGRGRVKCLPFLLRTSPMLFRPRGPRSQDQWVGPREGREGNRMGPVVRGVSHRAQRYGWTRRSEEVSDVARTPTVPDLGVRRLFHGPPVPDVLHGTGPRTPSISHSRTGPRFGLLGTPGPCPETGTGSPGRVLSVLSSRYEWSSPRRGPPVTVSQQLQSHRSPVPSSIFLSSVTFSVFHDPHPRDPSR